MLACVDSRSGFTMLYGLARNAHTLATVKGYMAAANHVGTPRYFRIEGGGEFCSRNSIDCRDDVRIRRVYTAPDALQQNVVAETASWRAMQVGHASRCEAWRLFLAKD